VSHRLVIAIDGPSGAGKSTAGRALAARLGYTFLDTGAMYRALGLKALRRSLPLDDPHSLTELARVTRIELTDGGRGVRLDGEDVTSLIRTQEVSSAASRLSVHSGVRREMVARQREVGQGGGVVLDGRDIGTTVFPAADVKFYMDAAPKRRVERRAKELVRAGAALDEEAVERQIEERDRLDMTRADSPLTRASDAVYLDTTDLTPEEVLQRMLQVVASRQAAAEG